MSARLSGRNVAVRKIIRCTKATNKTYCCYDAGRSCTDLGCMKDLRPEQVIEAVWDVWRGNARLIYEC